jgi:ubiquinone/menaquinone biosynthesis C-methylase UbiE
MTEPTRPSREREIQVHHVAAEGFDRSADSYERSRPSYPEAAVSLLVERLGLGPGGRVLDLAAGTGKMTRLLVPTGAEIVALEPVPGMRAQLEGAVPGVEVIDGTAESVPVGDASFDAVVCAQAWHWFDSPTALAEMARILRPPDAAAGRRGGGLAVVFNIRDERVDWVREVTRITEFLDAERPHHRATRERIAAEVEASSGFGPVERHTFRYVHRMTPELLVERMASQSNVAVMDDDKRTAVLGRVLDLARTHPDLAGRDQFDMPYDTEVALCFRR